MVIWWTRSNSFCLFLVNSELFFEKKKHFAFEPHTTHGRQNTPPRRLAINKKAQTTSDRKRYNAKNHSNCRFKYVITPPDASLPYLV